jgi:hypothetical protein
VNQFEDPQRHALGHRPGVANRTDTGRATVLTFAPGNQIVCAPPQLLVHPEQRLAEADPAWIVVVDEDPWFV